MHGSNVATHVALFDGGSNVTLTLVFGFSSIKELTNSPGIQLEKAVYQEI